MRIPWKRILQGAMALLAIGFLVALIAGQWKELSTYRWQLAPGWALLALAGLECAWLVELDTWRVILGSLGGQLPFRRAAPVWFLSNIVRYIPGNVWQFLAMSELAADAGVPRLATLTSIVLHQAISTAAGIVLAAVYFGFALRVEWLSWLRPFLWAAPLGLLLLQPRILERVLNWMLERMKRPPLRVTLTWGQIWVLLLRYVVVWLVMGVSFAALVRAITPLTWSDVPYLTFTWAAAYVIGYLSLITPSGLGVREGVMTLLLVAVLPEPVAAVIAIVARLWMTAGEIVGSAGAVVSHPESWRRLRRRSSG